MENLELNDFLSEETYPLVDAWCGKPIAYYRMLTHQLPESTFGKIRSKLLYSNGMERWLYITKKVTREECITLYGEITEEEYGPRGGWKSVTFGTTKFKHDFLRPSPVESVM
jgi:hypothetical protein